MFKQICWMTFSLCMAKATSHALNASDLQSVSRDEWGANPPKRIEEMATPVPYVVVHHSYEPPACESQEDCVAAMKWMQDFHQNTNDWFDIGYNWAVGGDLRAYEGRGWSRIGAHAPSYNNKSIGICIIGDWSDRLPSVSQLEVVHILIEYGVELGIIEPNYHLVGHRQVRNGTSCPGDALYDEIKTWDNFLYLQ